MCSSTVAVKRAIELCRSDPKLDILLQWQMVRAVGYCRRFSGGAGHEVSGITSRAPDAAQLGAGKNLLRFYEREDGLISNRSLRNR